MRTPTRTATAAAVAVAAVLVPAATADAGTPRIGPRQYFAGLVNGSPGRPEPAVIKVVCPGPAGRTGHPVSGQTVEVRPATATTGAGYTGTGGTSVGLFFGAPPPGGAGPGQVSFTHYGVAKPIPTSLLLPCSGTGVVTFVPFPRNPPTSRSVGVAVEYVNVGVARAG